MSQRIVLYEGEGLRIECDGVNHYTVFATSTPEEILSPCLDPKAYHAKVETRAVFGQALTGRHKEELES